MLARAAQSLKLRSLDAADRLAGRGDALVPPRRQLSFVGDSDYRATGDEFLGHFIKLAGLQPHERVLDVGSGIGRMARPLAGYLDASGSYDGFDIVPEGVAWCREHYAAAHPNFRFGLAEVANGYYRPGAGVAAGAYRFPHRDASFDFAFATSVFTHLLPEEADHYLAELARVVRPGGRILVTAFVLADEHRDRPVAGRMAFAHRYPGYALDDPDAPEAAIAFEPAWLQARLAAHGLLPRGPIRYGAWSGRQGGTSFQDIVLAERP